MNLPQEQTRIDCPSTGMLLYLVEADGSTCQVAPYGKCEECAMELHELALRLPNGVEPSKYPVIWEGLWCKDCWVKDE